MPLRQFMTTRRKDNDMARKLVKRDWGQAKGGYTPFAKSSAKAASAPCYCYDAFDAKGKPITVKCAVHR